MTATDGVDLGDPAQVQDWIDTAAAAHGGFDVLFNNASTPRFRPLVEMSDDDWHFTVRNELDLVFYACRAAWPHLVARGGGSVINTGSIAGLRAQGAIPGQFAHAATKGAVIAMTRELAKEGAPDRIRVNSISPGIILTPASAPLFEDAELLAAARGTVMLDRFGTVEDVASAALHLASDESSWTTGANLVVDGGFTAW
jgi:meso-butanediol dehydrogenase / (S,S)-butanediol dehydrogenase / diacetyl reductase